MGIASQRHLFEAENLLRLESLVMARVNNDVDKIKNSLEEVSLRKENSRKLFDEYYELLRVTVTARRFVESVFMDLKKLIKEGKNDDK